MRDIGGTRAVEFAPIGDSLSVPQYARNKDAATDQACLAWLGNLPTSAGH